MELNDKLKELDSYPFHMPGHKRNQDFNITGSEIDITEIDGFDNLHNASGVLAKMETELSNIYGYDKSIISVNGSTCCILSAISAVCNKGDKIIIARNCHKSVYNACYLNELDITYIEPEYNQEFGVYTYISQENLDKALKKCPNACAVVITSPTYEGFISHIKCSIPLIVDSAHGAHFGIAKCNPAKLSGDIVIQSLHKTLPALTQTAVMHINNKMLYSDVKKYMDIYESSSPSYVLLASIGRCIDFLKDCKKQYAELDVMLEDFYNFASKLNNIKALKNDDKSRIVLMSKSISGTQFANELRSKYKIEVEGATINYCILISTVCDTKKGFENLKLALTEIDKTESNFTPYTQKIDIPEKKLKISEVKSAKPIAFCDSLGMTCGEYVFAYPPGVPIIVPGEIISQSIINNISQLINAKVNIISDSNLLPKEILVY